MNIGLLVLTAGFGEGHNAAARAVAAAWDAEHATARARIVDVFALAAPRLNPLARRAYLGVINRCPRLWSATYRWVDHSRFVPWLLRRFRGELRILARELAAHQPDAICSTYPIYALWLQALAQAGVKVAPYFNVVTDSISINSLWWRGRGDGWFAPNEESATVLRRAGVGADRILVTGFPVALDFQRLNGKLAPPNLQLWPSQPKVLHLVHSGTRGAAEIARGLLKHSTWEITCAVGRDEQLRNELARIAARRPAPTRVLGWTEDVPRLLFSHHVVVSKAGGATTQEALAAACPMIVTQVVPGQEEGNWELLRRNKIGALALSPGAVTTELEQAFANGGRIWWRWREAAERIARPAAAQAIAAAIARKVESASCGSGAAS